MITQRFRKRKYIYLALDNMKNVWNSRSGGASEKGVRLKEMTESKGRIPKAPVCDLRTLMIPNGYTPPLEIDISLSSDCVV